MSTKLSNLQLSFTHNYQLRCSRRLKHISREKLLAPICSLAEPVPFPAAGDILPPKDVAPAPSAVSKLDSIPPARLKELRRTGHEQKDVIKLGRRGVCEPLVAQIRNRWKTSEVAKLYCSGRPAADMKALAGALEGATGGIVVHRTGGSVLLYRGDIIKNESTQADDA